MNKGLTRLIFIFVFLIPVVWYLFLQTFGSNNFSLSLLSEVPGDCEQMAEITVVAKQDSLSVVETNYMNRVVYAVKGRSIPIVQLDEEYFDCVNQNGSDLVLVSKKGIWGGYTLNREGVDQLITELDILKLQESYGKGTSR